MIWTSFLCAVTQVIHFMSGVSQMCADLESRLRTMAMQQDEERMRFGTLVEHGAVLWIPDRSGAAQDGVEFVGAEAGEDWNICDD